VRSRTELSAEQGGHNDIPAGFELAVGLHDDAVAQAVEEQRLLGLGQPELPRCSGMLDAGQRGCAGPAVVPGDEDHIGMCLGYACRDGSDADFGDQLHVDPRDRVGVLQVVNELGEVLDRVDVVVRRR
jgi:hypothetical protein